MGLPGIFRQGSTAASTSSKPRVSSPLATNSYSSSAYTDSDEEGSNESGSDSDDATMHGAERSADVLDDDEDDFEDLLKAAKENARARQSAQDGGVNLEDVNFGAMQQDDDALPAVYTRPAIPSQVFEDATSAKGKGKERATSAPDAKEEEEREFIPGVPSKWGELPRQTLTKSQKKARHASSDKKNWFDLPYRAASSLTNEEKREIQALRLSTVMDPKRFMRGEAKRENKKLPEHFQMGYIIESSQSAKAGLAAPSTKIHKQSFLGNLTKDEKGLSWAKRKYAEVQAKGASGGKGHWKKRMNDRKSFGSAGKGKGKKRH